MKTILIFSVLMVISLTVAVVLRLYSVKYLQAHKHSKYDNFEDYMRRTKPSIYRVMKTADRAFIISAVFFIISLGLILFTMG